MFRQFVLAAALVALPAAASAQQAPLINGAALAGDAPAAGSARDAADRLSMRPNVTEARLTQARADQEASPWRALAPVMGDQFTETRLPQTARMFASLRAALGPSVNTAKEAANRRRPFLSDPSVARCDPPTESVAQDSSYPSGHAAIGWAWGLVMAELLPARADALLQRGRDFGDSRVVCGYHFPSDIEASRLIAAAVVARLHGEANFRAELEAARRELARAYR
ncbi:MAG: phosphatase PAP2 family protein [Hyphomonadaceae bacterium]